MAGLCRTEAASELAVVVAGELIARQLTGMLGDRPNGGNVSDGWGKNFPIY